jgi:hypothetical protein
MSGHDPVHVLMAEDDPGDALMVRESSNPPTLTASTT